MTPILCLIFFTSVWVLGLTIATQQGMIFYSFRKWAAYHAQEDGPSFFHAVILCPWCMPSIHSLIGYGFCILAGIINPTDGKIWLFYPIVICGSSLVAGIVWTIYETILSYKEKAEAEITKLETQTKYLTNVEQLSFFDILDRKKEHQKRDNNYSKSKSMNHERS